MKFFHISDLHIGKQLHNYSLQEEQRDILNKIIEEGEKQKIDALLISGDIYDKSVPSAEACEIFNEFLINVSLKLKNTTVFIIAGNHDNGYRLNFASSFLEKSNIYIEVFPPSKEEDNLKCITLTDDYGDINFYLLPFVKPGYVRNLFKEGESIDYNKAVSKLIERENIDYKKRNIILSHQFYISGENKPDTCDSEQLYLSVGGIDSVDINCIKNFDYAALGHIHGMQKMGKDYIRYSGTPLKYSISEEHHKKTITMVEIKNKGEISYEFIPLVPLRDVISLKGTLEDILNMSDEKNKLDYVCITLTNEEDIYRPKDLLLEKFQNILEVRKDNKRTRSALLEKEIIDYKILDPITAFKEFYMELNDQPLSKEEEDILVKITNSFGMEE